MTTAPAAPRRRAGDVRSRSIWRWQLILAAAAVTIIVTVALLDPPRLGNPLFLTGAAGIVLLACAALLVPWHRVSPAGVAILPLANIVAIAFLSSIGETRASLLWVFPVAWLATYYSVPWVAAGLLLISVALTVETFLVGIRPDFVQRAVIVMLCMTFLAITIGTGSRRIRAYNKLLRRQFVQLDRVRRRAENQAQRTAILADSLETGIARFDRDGVLLDANHAYLSLYGASSIAAFTTTGAVEYDQRRGRALPPDQTITARAAVGTTLHDERVWLYDRDGAWRALSVTMRPIPADNDLPAGSLVIVHDETSAVEAQRERDDVARVVSHELRNPLTAILGHTDLLLERDDLSDELRRKLETIEHAGYRMERLVTSALEGAPVRDDERVAARLDDLVEASITAFAPSAAAAQISITPALEETPAVTMDAFRLRQAIDNLLGNALKYTPRGGTVTVTTATDETGVTLTVADTGMGMQADDLHRVFEQGFRSEAALRSKITGSGLGLRLVKGIVDAHGGTIDITSQLGRGTQVTLWLPGIPSTEGASL